MNKPYIKVFVKEMFELFKFKVKYELSKNTKIKFGEFIIEALSDKNYNGSNKILKSICENKGFIIIDSGVFKFIDDRIKDQEKEFSMCRFPIDKLKHIEAQKELEKVKRFIDLKTK